MQNSENKTNSGKKYELKSAKHVYVLNEREWARWEANKLENNEMHQLKHK